MKIWTLIENTTCRTDLSAEHGLSLYIESRGKRILFDMGQSEAFAQNAETLGIDLKQVDLAIVSHGHYDHGGSLGRFLQINASAPVYLTPEALEPHYHGEKYIGLARELPRERLCLVQVRTEIAPGMTLYRDIPLAQPMDPAGLSVLEKGIKIAEDFRHEQYLLMEENGLRILFSGCSHRGIENIAGYFHPDILIGGFHFSKLPPDSPRLRSAARMLSSINCVYYTCHCTGQSQFDAMKQILGPRLHNLTTGTVLEIPTQKRNDP